MRNQTSKFIEQNQCSAVLFTSTWLFLVVESGSFAITKKGTTFNLNRRKPRRNREKVPITRSCLHYLWTLWCITNYKQGKLSMMQETLVNLEM